jgi:hypothetical protein
LKDFGKLVIKQGDEEALTIECSPHIMKRVTVEVKEKELILGIKGGYIDRFADFLSSSLSGHQVTFNLYLKELRSLNISGAGSGSANGITTDQLVLKLGGAGSIKMEGLTARKLEVTLTGTGKIDLVGKVDNQIVSISGAGGYIARKLESKTAKVSLSGAGKGILWATDDLDISITGLGSVDYYGNPNLKQNITGLGNVVGLGKP